MKFHFAQARQGPVASIVDTVPPGPRSSTGPPGDTGRLDATPLEDGRNVPAALADSPARPRRVLSLMYHDVLDDGAEASGFEGAGPERYKLGWPRFREQLGVLSEVMRGVPPSLVTDARRDSAWTLTFDDGGSSALEVGRVLAARGWLAHFFVTVDRIGEPGFVGVEGIRELAALGHVVGSHTCSHPARMSKCSMERLLDEWGRSASVLSEIVEAEVRVASVPGGGYSKRVALAAEMSGIRSLFTSEPRITTFSVGECLVLGRFAVHRDTDSARVAAIAGMKTLPRAQEYAEWTALKLAKTVGGDTYLKARKSILARRASRRPKETGDEAADGSRRRE